MRRGSKCTILLRFMGYGGRKIVLNTKIKRAGQNAKQKVAINKIHTYSLCANVKREWVHVLETNICSEGMDYNLAM